MKSVKHALVKSHKDLPVDKEIELVLWWGFLEDSIDDAFVLTHRWKRLKNVWDLKTLVIIIAIIEEARVNLKQYLSIDTGLWEVFKTFERKYRLYKLGDLRNDIIHPRMLFKLKKRNGQPFLKTPILNIGGYSLDKDVFTYGSNVIIVSDVIEIVENLSKEIRGVLESKLKDFYKTGRYEGMIPWTALHGFKKKGGMKSFKIPNPLKVKY